MAESPYLPDRGFPLGPGLLGADGDSSGDSKLDIHLTLWCFSSSVRSGDKGEGGSESPASAQRKVTEMGPRETGPIASGLLCLSLPYLEQMRSEPLFAQLRNGLKTQMCILAKPAGENPVTAVEHAHVVAIGVL